MTEAQYSFNMSAVHEWLRQAGRIQYNNPDKKDIDPEILEEQFRQDMQMFFGPGNIMLEELDEIKEADTNLLFIDGVCDVFVVFHNITYALGIEIPGSISVGDQAQSFDSSISLLRQMFSQFNGLSSEDYSLYKSQPLLKSIVESHMSTIMHMVNACEKDIVPYLEAVHKSNFSKYTNSLEEAKDTVEAYANGTHPNGKGKKLKCRYIKPHDKYVIILDEGEQKGKVMKNLATFKEPEYFMS